MRAGRMAFAVTCMSIGVVHAALLKPLAAIVPDPLPAHRALVLAAGWSASAAGVALLLPRTRRPAAWFMVAWLLAVYPANLWMALKPERYHQIPQWMLWARLPLQLPMLWWAYLYTRPDRSPDRVAQ